MPRSVDPTPLAKVKKKHFTAFESVRRSGMFNMLTQAREAADFAGLGIEDYMGVLKNYEALMAKWPDVRKGA